MQDDCHAQKPYMTEASRQARYRHVKFFDDAAVAQKSSCSCGLRESGSRAVVSRASEALESEAADFFHWLLPRAGVHPGRYRVSPLMRRLSACLRAVQAGSIAEARQRLDRDPCRLAKAISSVLIGVTAFFRDAQVFEYLDHVVFPAFSHAAGPLRIWSAGCADGAELYSAAILLSRRGLLDRCSLLGTDCRLDALAKAERGWFASPEVAGVPRELLHEYFVRDRGGWRVGEVLRRATRWVPGDVLQGPPTGETAWDLILCRNVAIYLEPSACWSLWSTLAEALRPGGVLVTGKAERPQDRLLIRMAPCVFEKRGYSR